MKTKHSLWKTIRIACLAIVLLYAALAVFIFVLFSYGRSPLVGLFAVDMMLVRGPIKRYMNPVTGDDQMIARFNAHRAEFEKLVRIHKERCLTDTWTERPRPEIEQMMKPLGLIHVRTDKLSLWFPDPYSEQAFERTQAMRRESHRMISEAARAGDRSVEPEIEKKECRYSAAMFYWEKFPTDSLGKGLIYFPVAPKVAGGELYRPAYTAPDNPLHYEEVLESLDGLLSRFWRFHRSCKFRRFEAQWFLFVCPI